MEGLKLTWTRARSLKAGAETSVVDGGDGGTEESRRRSRCGGLIKKFEPSQGIRRTDTEALYPPPSASNTWRRGYEPSRVRGGRIGYGGVRV